MALGGGLLPNNVGADCRPVSSKRKKGKANAHKKIVCHTTECCVMNLLQPSLIDFLTYYGIVFDITPAWSDNQVHGYHRSIQT